MRLDHAADFDDGSLMYSFRFSAPITSTFHWIRHPSPAHLPYAPLSQFPLFSRFAKIANHHH